MFFSSIKRRQTAGVLDVTLKFFSKWANKKKSENGERRRSLRGFFYRSGMKEREREKDGNNIGRGRC